MGVNFATPIVPMQQLLNADVPGGMRMSFGIFDMRMSFGIFDMRDFADLEILAMTSPRPPGSASSRRRAEPA